MRVLYYYSLDAYSRIVRIVLSEKMVDFSVQHELPWKLSEKFKSCSSYEVLPTFVDNNGICISGVFAIIEYLEETIPDPVILGYTVKQKAEARQIAYWFISEFSKEVLDPILQEKVLKRFATKTSSEPNPGAIRNAMYNIPRFLDRIIYVLERRSWLVGRNLSIADISVASFISVLEYLGILKWSNYSEALLTWYLKIKSRKSFRPLLTDIISMIPPSRNYAKLDY